MARLTASPAPSVAFALIALATAGATQERELPSALQSRVNAAVERGIDALLRLQELDGSWRQHQDGYPTGVTALCLQTLVESGLPVEHQAVQRGAAFVRAHPPSKTYEAACQLLGLASLGAEEDGDRLAELAELLLSWQLPGGGFAYPEGKADLSNAQYAALGLRAAELAGALRAPDRAWRRLGDATLLHQEVFADDAEPAGFSYRDGVDATGSMTAAGIATLTICEQLGPKSRVLGPARDRGLAWLAEHFSIERNPRPGFAGERDNFQTFRFYYFYGLERVAGLLGLREIGGHDWYLEGARFLVERQPEHGLWQNNPTSTCFALLFLNRATHAVSGREERSARSFGSDDPSADVSLRAAGDSPMVVWISSFGTRVGEELVHPGDEGQGPRVVGVEYTVVDASGGEPGQLASLTGSPDAPVGAERFPLRHSFARPGVYTIRATVTCRTPGAPGATTRLESAPLIVRVQQAWNDELVSYAGDAARDLLLRGEATVEASSAASAAFAARRVVDGLLASGWRSADDDPRPRMRVTLDEPQRGDVVLLSHAFDPTLAQPTHVGRIRRVVLRVNEGSPIEVELVADDWRKTIVPLARAVRVHTLELVVLDASPGREGRAGVGLAEIELQRRGR